MVITYTITYNIYESFDLTYILCTSVFTSTYFVFISYMFRASHLSF